LKRSWTDIPEWTLDVSKTIMQTVRVKDVATFEHCMRVSKGTRLLAQAAGLNELDQKIVEFAGMFHDIGKIGIPDEILMKPAKLTNAEFNIMKEHPEKSVEILQPLAHVEFYARLIPGVRYHHERFDGSGYPHEISGEDIPLVSRLILVVDTFDAMTADRAYRKGLPPEVARQELKDFAGRQFDPRLVKIFCEAQPKWRKEDYLFVQEMEEEVLKRAA
jgi:putative nucleotidyltransferase with HDIG domain